MKRDGSGAGGQAVGSLEGPKVGLGQPEVRWV